jgi:hypothetical protein
MWFIEIAEVENPARQELHRFVEGVLNFLDFVLNHPEEFRFLWEEDPELRSLALETFTLDVLPSAAVLHDRIEGIRNQALIRHGLVGRPARFKFQVLNVIANRWERVKKRGRIRGWFKRIVDGIDAILDSLIEAAGGAGGLIKEFKDSLCALTGEED